MFQNLETIQYLRIVIIKDVETGNTYPIEILPIQHSDYKFLTIKRYSFNWKKEKEKEVYKLIIKGQNDILGLISIETIHAEWRIHIGLLCVSKENVGKAKKFENIAGNLISFVAKIAVKEFGEFACVSLRPKTAIAQHYIDAYKMNKTGATLSLEVPEIIDLINKFEHEK